MNGYFVTGTDTNVGKTVLSALLVAALDAVYWKPVQTGAVEGTDRESVRAWANVPEERLPSERYRFDPPVSPHAARSLDNPFPACWRSRKFKRIELDAHPSVTRCEVR